MANYKMHSTINLAIALPILIGLAAILLRVPYHLTITFTVAYVYGTLFMTPDADVADKVKLLSLRGILGLPFRSYAKVFSHRGLSHSFVLGTATRILWLALHVLPILYVVYEITPTDKVFIKFLRHYQWYFAAAGVGLFLSDTCHLIVDMIWSIKAPRRK